MSLTTNDDMEARILGADLPQDFIAWKLASLTPYARCMNRIATEFEQRFTELKEAANAGKDLRKAALAKLPTFKTPEQIEFFVSWIDRELLSLTTQYNLAAIAVQEPLTAMLRWMERTPPRTLTDFKADRAVLDLKLLKDDVSLVQAKYYEMHRERVKERAALKRAKASSAQYKWGYLAQLLLRREIIKKSNNILTATRIAALKRSRPVHKVLASGPDPALLADKLTPAEMANIGGSTDDITSPPAPLKLRTDSMSTRREGMMAMEGVTSHTTFLKSLADKEGRCKRELVSRQKTKGTLASNLRMVTHRLTELEGTAVTPTASGDDMPEVFRLNAEATMLRKQISRQDRELRAAMDEYSSIVARRAEAQKAVDDALDSANSIGSLTMLKSQPGSRFNSIVASQDSESDLGLGMSVYEVDDAPLTSRARGTSLDDMNLGMMLPTPKMDFPVPSNAASVLGKLDHMINGVKSIYGVDMSRSGRSVEESVVQTDSPATATHTVMTDSMPPIREDPAALPSPGSGRQPRAAEIQTDGDELLDFYVDMSQRAFLSAAPVRPGQLEGQPAGSTPMTAGPTLSAEDVVRFERLASARLVAALPTDVRGLIQTRLEHVDYQTLVEVFKAGLDSVTRGQTAKTGANDAYAGELEPTEPKAESRCESKLTEDSGFGTDVDEGALDPDLPVLRSGRFEFEPLPSEIAQKPLGPRKPPLPARGRGLRGAVVSLDHAD
ncbi:hypothetical protein J8273_5435 [Carpediemonas membranifera]|uniref:Uncharacterized protein n=1 Tax=Carpediemonas membranifera TaxID=201153 RepID=A0A8J6B3W6_9EUKA|nr:hypothetical protein J8273_5435 [Carpediemonas membranifera]|eukprot:KAG9392444.1 hypothetical protein J8273_5435 [Carpediemonas membranifera]